MNNPTKNDALRFAKRRPSFLKTKGIVFHPHWKFPSPLPNFSLLRREIGKK